MTSMDFGSLVYVAAHPVPAAASGEAEVVFELGTTTNDEVVGVAFTSAERLVEVAGADQPWVCLPIGALQVLLGDRGVRQILVDPPYSAPPARSVHRELAMSDFQVILDDLGSAASAFSQEGASIEKLGSTFTSGVPDCGVGRLTSSLGQLLGAFELLNGSLANGCDETGTKLRQTHDSYHQTDDDVLHLFRKLMPND